MLNHPQLDVELIVIRNPSYVCLKAHITLHNQWLPSFGDLITEVNDEYAQNNFI